MVFAPAPRRSHFDGGGTVDVAPPAYIGANPMVQQLYQRFAGLPLEKLQQLAVIMPPSSFHGQMVQRALRAKQLAPASAEAFPTVSADVAAPGFPPAQPQGYDGGGAVFGGSGSFPSWTPPIDPAARPILPPGSGFHPMIIGGGANGMSNASGLPSSAASTPESIGGASTEPFLQREALLQQQGLTPAQIGQAMMGGLPGAGGSARANAPARQYSPSAPPIPSGGFSGIGGWNGWAGLGFPSAGGFYGGSPFSGGFGGTAFARPGYGMALPMTYFSAGIPGQVGPTWAPGQPLLSPASPVTTTPAGFGSPPAPPKVTPQPTSAAPAAPAATSAAPSLSTAQSAALQQAVQNGQLAWNGRSYVDPTNPLAMNPSSNFGRGGDAAARYNPHLREVYHPGGFLNSPVAGRTDHLALAVPVGSHVIPADIVSGLGEGNSLNGARLLDHVFHAGPWGDRALKVRGSASTERPDACTGRDGTTSIMAAGGEYVVRPEAVAEIGRRAKERDTRLRKSDLEVGHDAIDRFILDARKHIVATTRKLPGPVKG